MESPAKKATRITSKLINDLIEELHEIMDDDEKKYYGALRTELPSLVSWLEVFDVHVQITIYLKGHNKVKVINEGCYCKLVVRPGDNGIVEHNWETFPIKVLEQIPCFVKLVITANDTIKSFIELLQKFRKWLSG